MSLSRIDTNSISAGAIQTADIAANAITSAQISANSITTVQIAANAITASQIAPGAIPPSIPTGTIAAFAGNPGSGWLEANGQIVSQVTYSDLYSKVGLLADAFSTTSYIAGLTKMDDSASTGRFTAVVYGNSTYVVGQRHSLDVNPFSIYTSTDAVTWTARSVNWPSSFLYPLAMVYTDKFVMSAYVTGTALTNRNYFFTSTDGITWTTRTGASSSNGYVNSLVYGGSTYAATNANGINGIQTSTDGITWTQRTLAVSVSLDGLFLAYGNSTWVLLSYGPSGSSYISMVQTSTDAITWTYRTVLPDFSYPLGICFANGLFYAIGDAAFGGTVSPTLTSTDGITWSTATVLMASVHYPATVAYDSTNSLLYATGGVNVLGNSNTGYAAGSSVVGISSDNGVTWEVRPVGAAVKSTTTTTGSSPVNIVGYTPRFDVPTHSLCIANNKIFYGNTVRAANNSDAGLRTKALTIKIDSPYTYQTDTQFALPSIAASQSGIAVSPTLANLKLSTAPFVVGKNVKYYIKT